MRKKNRFQLYDLMKRQKCQPTTITFLPFSSFYPYSWWQGFFYVAAVHRAARHIMGWNLFCGRILAFSSQRPRMDLNKKSLPRPKTTTAGKPYSIGLISARVKILHIGNFFLSKMSLNVSTVKLFLYSTSMVSVGMIKALGSYNMASCCLCKKNQDQTCWH